ncbi:MAG: hypothetical protein HUU35_05175 [Armatimonadetes bacterium]|nr:hypothetical protein [Armatimonadota bacterium]
MKRFLFFHSGTLGQMDLAFNITIAIFTLGLWLIPMNMSPKKCIRCGKRQEQKGGGLASAIGLFLAALFTLGMCLIPKLFVIGMLVGLAVAVLLVIGKIFVRELNRGDDPA